jgi:hypothetical protein
VATYGFYLPSKFQEKQLIRSKVTGAHTVDSIPYEKQPIFVFGKYNLKQVPRYFSTETQVSSHTSFSLGMTSLSELPL